MIHRLVSTLYDALASYLCYLGHALPSLGIEIPITVPLSVFGRELGIVALGGISGGSLATLMSSRFALPVAEAKVKADDAQKSSSTRQIGARRLFLRPNATINFVNFDLRIQMEVILQSLWSLARIKSSTTLSLAVDTAWRRRI